MKPKKRFSPFSVAAALYFAALLVPAIVSLLSGRVSVTTDFMSIIPSYGIDEGVAAAEKAFIARQNGRVNILFSHADFDLAREAALEFCAQMSGSGVFASLSSEASSEGFDVSEIAAMLNKSRYALIPKALREDIANSPEEFQAAALSSIYSPFSLMGLSSLDRDPFFLDNAIAADIFAKASAVAHVMPKEGVLAAERGGEWNVLVRGELSAESLNMTNTKGGIKTIYKVGDTLEKKTAGLRVSYSGFSFHSQESASSAQKEIAAISFVSILLIVAMFLVLLRNVQIIGLFLLGIALSLLAGFAALAAFFSEIHILTMIFGTSLIGTSIDYSIHFYIAYAKRSEGEMPFAVVKRLSTNLTISLASTVLCYALIVFSPYSVLRQVGVFSFFGLIGSFLAVTGFFPLIVRDSMICKIAPAWRIKPVRPHRSYIPFLFIAAVALLIFSVSNIKVSNSVADLYQMSDRLLESEKTVGAVMGYMSTNYAIIKGENELDAREKEAVFSRQLAALEKTGEIGRYLSPSLFIPPLSEMQESIEISQNVLAPMLESQCELLGLDSTTAFTALKESAAPLLFSDLPQAFSGMLDELIAGSIGGAYYLIAMIFDASPDIDIKAIAAECEGVTYFQKVKDVNAQLDALTAMLLRFFLIAFALIIVLLIAVFKKKAFYIAASPVITVSVLLSSMALMGRGIDFFFAVGMLLAIGLGLDYMVFAANSASSALLPVSLCYFTTALSFGSLAASSFSPVHIFGLAVIIGITAAWICALSSQVKEKE